jgi:hypothetical protein
MRPSFAELSHPAPKPPKEIRARGAAGLRRAGALRYHDGAGTERPMTAAGDPAPTPSLARFFERVVRQALGDLRLGGPTEGAYLSGLLTRFARTDELYAIRDAVGQPLDSVAALLIEAERAWDFGAPDFDPFRERRVRQHVGDFALFMTGLFREHVERRVGAAYYVRQGQRAYQAVADFERSALRPEARLFGALAAGFERYAAALGYLKRVYFPPAAAAPDVRPVLRLLTEW